MNAQNFSIVKSLNRAVTALTSGTQVLSAGYPLYDVLGDYIYADPAALIGDLDEENLLLSPSRVDAFQTLMHHWADPEHETVKFVDFLKQRLELPVANSARASDLDAPASLVAALHGRKSTGAVHKFIQRMGGLSIATPFAPPNLNYDVRFQRDGLTGAIEILVSETYAQAIPRKVAKILADPRVMIGKTYVQIIPQYEVLEDVHTVMKLHLEENGIFNFATYNLSMQAFYGMAQQLFPGIQIFMSEQAQSPLYPIQGQSIRSESAVAQV